MTRKANLLTLVICTIIGLTISSPAAFSQDHSIADAKGTQQHRDYFSQLPFEQVDTATGALVLTFTDLVLPGARGRDLKFQRIYNSKDDKWRFAIAGYPLYIRDPGFAPPGIDMQLIEWAFTPIIFGHDGAAHRTYPRDSVDTNQPTTMNTVMTLDFWRYERGSAQLRLPDGTICNYEAVPGSAVEKRLKQCWAPFLVEVSQPELFIDWDAGTVSNLHKMPVERTVTVAGLRHDGVPQSLSFQGRTWTYEWGTTSRFLPPQGTGPGWEIEATPYFDSAERTLTVKTPHGGKIAYVFQNQHFPQFDNDYDDYHSRDSHSEVLAERRLFDRGHTEPQRWYYTYGNQNPDGSTTIQTPEDVRILYRHEGNGEDPPRVTAREVAVYENNEWRLLERESRTYTQVPVIHFPPGSGPSAIYKSDYVLASRIVWRDERQYSTYYEYRTAPSAPDDVGGWVGDYHQPWRITENGVGLTGSTARVSVREYRHADTVGSVLNVGHLAKETVTVGTESFVKEWDVSPGTGTVSSQTVHGVTTTFSSFFFGQPLSVRDANNRTTTLEYTHGLVSRVGSPEHAVSRVIDADGTLRAETRGAGTVNALTTRYEYDPAFRPTTITPPQAAGGRHETRIEYDPAGTWVRTTRGTSVVTTVLDGFGRPVEIITSEGVSTRSRYDTEGRKVFEGYPIPVGAPEMGTAIAYDGLNRMTRRTHPDSTFVTYTYGPGAVTIVDEEQRTTVHHTEAFGNPDETRLVKVIDAANKSWNYTYNALGRLRLVTAPDDTTRTFEYYPDTSWLLSETHPESGTATYTYDSVGTLLTRTNAENQTTTYTYDANYRLKTIAAAGESLAISYRTGLDDRAQITSGSHVVNFRYDGAGRLAKAETVTDGRRRELSYSWDANDNLQTLMYPSLRRIQFTYDSGNRIQSIRDVLSGTQYGAAFDYHPSGAVSSYTAGNGIPFAFDYDPDRYWPTLIASGPLGLTYGQYDAVGNVGVISDSRGGSWNQTFTYDDLDRLASATGAYGARAYAYDDHGNMLGDGAATFTYNPSTLRLATRNGQALSYNNNGSVTGGINGTFTYTGRNQLASAAVGGQTSTYKYDVDEWRIVKTTPSGTTYYFRGPGGQLLSEMTVSGTAAPTYRDYIYAGTRLIGAVER